MHARTDAGPGPVICIDADSVAARALVRALAQAGFPVVAHTRAPAAETFPDGVAHIVSTDVAADFDAWQGEYGAFTHAVFGVRALDELGYDLVHDGAAFVDVVEAHIATFLSDLRTVAMAMARADGRQVWVLTQEDSMAFCMRMAAQPLVTGARHAAVKSLAREVLRFGLSLNCANLQLLAEQAPAPAWRQARDSLKAFSTKFQPVEAASVAQTLTGFMRQPAIPFSGLVLPFGIGVPEVNV